MYYFLQTLLIGISVLHIGFGGGISAERTRIARERWRIERMRDDALLEIETRGMTFAEKLKARGAASLRRRAAREAQIPMPNP
jgi:hypothetical protein